MPRRQRKFLRPSFAASWQLLVLATTSIVLSLASGWTTWIGMQNFTGESVLSLMITIGVQGIMLVLAWMVGTRLADQNFGHSSLVHQSDTNGIKFLLSRTFELLSIIQIGLISICLTYVFLADGLDTPFDILKDEDLLIYLMVGLTSSIIILLAFRFGAPLIQIVFNIFRSFVQNFAQISMLIVCVLISIFFSFDALFSQILPETERVRIADLRSKTDVASVINELVNTTEKSRRHQARKFLAAQEWQDYEATLTKVGAALQSLPISVAASIDRDEQRALSYAQEHRKELRGLEAEKRVIERRKLALQKRLDDKLDQAGSVDGRLSQLDRDLSVLDRRILDKAAQVDAEEQGLGVTSRRGRGPAYKKLKRELDDLRGQQLSLNAQRLGFSTQNDKRRVEIEQIEKSIALVSTELEQVSSRIELQRRKGKSGAPTRSISDVRSRTEKLLTGLKEARLKFEQDPRSAALSNLHAQCIDSVSYISSFAITADAAKRSTCDIISAQSAAARVFQLNGAGLALTRNCAGSNSKLSTLSFEGRVSFARDCLNMSSLLPSEAKSIAAQINTLERERDDQAHRFVVTLNAFLDGNKLALLALAIAAAIDTLVLTSGLLGATAMRSPMSGSGLSANLSASEREAIIETALLPDIPRNAHHALAEFAPYDASSGERMRQWTHRVSAHQLGDETQSPVLRRVINSGVVVGAVMTENSRDGGFLVNVSLVEFLSRLARKADGIDDSEREFQRLLAKALGDRPTERAAAVISYFVPSLRLANYSSQIDLAAAHPSDIEVLTRCLNVGSAFGHVAVVKQNEDDKGPVFQVNAELYLALLRLSSQALPLDSEASNFADYSTIEHSAARAEELEEFDEAGIEQELSASGTMDQAPQPAPIDQPPAVPAESMESVTALRPARPVEQEAKSDAPKQKPKILISNGTFSFD